MRIVLDLLACQGSSTNRGIGRYSLALAQAMLRQGGAHEFRIVLNNHFPDSVAKLRHTFADALPQSQISVFDLPAPIFEHDRNNSWRLRAAEQLREHYLADLRPDMVHMSSLFEGLGENACGSVLHNSGQYDNAITLYDLIPLIRKETYLTDPHVASWYYRKLQSLKNAELLLAISGHSRQEAMTALQLPGERVVNISSAVDTIFVPRTLAPEQAQALRARYGLTRSYIMYTGGIDYRKNIEGLIEAYAKLPGALRQQYQLAVVCSIPDGDRVRLNALAAGFGLAPADLVLTGFVSDDDLVSLYNLTSLFVFPSLQEGFGLPALEAMSCGVPVIGSNNSSIPEVIGRSDALFDPNSVADISAKMQHALTDADFSASLAAHGLVQAKLFSWDASARKALDAFEARHAQRQQAARSAVSVPDQLNGRRPRLAFVSPLPPERSGIGDARAFRRQWRDEGQARPSSVELVRHADGAARRLLALRMARLKGVERLACAGVPRKQLGLDQAVRGEAGAEVGVGQRMLHLGADVGHAIGVEQRVAAADHLGDAAVVGAYHRHAARHRLQRRQAEAFLQRRKHEQ